MDSRTDSLVWMRRVLLAAAAYNLLWGALVVLQPTLLFRLTGMDLPRYTSIWQCVGMVVGVYGVGYAIAAFNPLRHWPIVLVGLLGKIFGPIGFLTAAFSGELPWRFGWVLIGNDLIWWIPFAGILLAAWRAHGAGQSEFASSLEEVIETAESNRGGTIENLSARGPLLLVFVRHSGCTFCREMLADLGQQRARLEAQGVEIGVVHMGTPLEGTQMAIRNNLDGVHLFSDPECRMYEAFGLERGSVRQVLGPKIWWRGVWAGLIEGHGIGPVRGDAFRLQGAFLILQSETLAACRVRSAADCIDFTSLCRAARAEPTALPVA